MRTILEEFYSTINDETPTQWLIQISPQFSKSPSQLLWINKQFNDNERATCWVGVAQYMFIFDEDDGRRGTVICVIPEDVFESHEKYDACIEYFRNNLLNNTYDTLSNVVLA